MRSSLPLRCVSRGGGGLGQSVLQRCALLPRSREWRDMTVCDAWDQRGLSKREASDEKMR